MITGMLVEQPSHNQLFSHAWNLNKTSNHALFSKRCRLPGHRSSKSSRMVRSALVERLQGSSSVEEEIESEFIRELKQDLQAEEDPRLLREIWREVQGLNDWEGLLDPMNSNLRQEILRYGEFAQSSYDSFDFDPHSKYCGSCKYGRAEFFEKMDMAHYGYHICRYLYATSNINLEKFFRRSSSIRSIWSPHANWMGYVAVTSDEEEIKRLGRRDILIVWRGTVTYLEWIHDLKNILRPAHFRDNPHVQIESGFYDLYTTKEENCKFCSFSAREQVLAEVKRLVERFKGEKLSITVTGHSLGGALALLSAYDIAEMRLNIVRDEKKKTKKIPVTVYSFASPRVGNLKFKERCDELEVKQLRVVNVHDKVPTMPGLIANEKNKLQKYLEDTVHFPWSYAHVGTELALDHAHSPFLKPTADLSCAHNLEAHLHLVDGYRGKGRKFSLANKRDIALVNKDSDFLKSEYGVPPRWRQDHNKGMVRNSEGRWVVPDRARVEHHPPDTAHHFALAMKVAHDPQFNVLRGQQHGV
ncbi:phospholipase A1-Igamma3, chloroplastic-like isoform X2 [Chenopodium quinoa]|uniref:phospholipase A1-Igamma3, chloroplastic-like isoform X2 n=1 Tax=Chenopodium quinoa TaxID=63459 RepID=UPI000B772688|nr:phospholipase A1-Igamma3, chloroplastic-like isoform X2 [Chenopodium quinoa]